MNGPIHLQMLALLIGLLIGTVSACATIAPSAHAQFIGICSWWQLAYMDTSGPRRGAPLCTRLALQEGGDTQLFSQC
jgi:hypothetical protein